MKENKLIAEFMGYSSVGGVYVSRKDEFHIDEMQYDISWDWLMPVVSKCFRTGDDTHEWDNIMDTMFTCDINIVYNTVVEFIKQYNKNK